MYLQYMSYCHDGSSGSRMSSSCDVGHTDRCQWSVISNLKRIKMVPLATLLGDQFYNASTGFSPLTKCINKYCKANKKSDNDQCLY